MDNAYAARKRRWLITVLLSLGMAALASLALQTMTARQQGLSIPRALVFGLEHQWPGVAALAIAFLLYWMIHAAYVERAHVEAPNAVEGGRERWRRMRLIGGIVLAISVVIIGGALAVNIITHGWQRDDLVLLLLLVAYAAGLILIWVRKPSRGYLYTLETGDGSRTNDERAQLVQGKAAATALWILVAAVYIGGSLYEMVVLAHIPWRSITAAAAIFLLYAAAGMYWNRKL